MKLGETRANSALESVELVVSCLHLARFMKFPWLMANPSPGLRKSEYDRPMGLSEVPQARPQLGPPAWVALFGRILFSYLFIVASFGHFTPAYVAFAAHRGVPFPQLFVPIAGILALFGGLSVLLGFRARVGAWLLVLFLVPVTLMMHNFWADTDPAMAMANRINFMKNLSMLGGALLIAYFGAGPLSLDRRRNRS